MNSVLITIDGFTPNQGLFSYAVDLCRRMGAELSVLQVIRPGDGARYVEKLGKKAVRAGSFFENAMMAVTFAEANEHEMASEIIEKAQKMLEPLLSEPAGKGIRVSTITRMGNPEREIIDYVDRHREVVVAVCDCRARDAENEDDPQGAGENCLIAPLIARIRQKLPVPLVVWRSRKQTNSRTAVLEV